MSTAIAAPAVSWAGLDQQVSRYAPAHSWLEAEFSGGVCQSIHALNADQQLAIASTFKLDVLGELARQV